MGKVWLSKLVREIWELQFKMWDYRNKQLYVKGDKLYKIEVQAINHAMRFEFAIRRNKLGLDYKLLFQGNVEALLKKSIYYKTSQLVSVWVGRDWVRKEEGLGEWYKDPLASTFLNRERVRKKRKLEENFASL